MIQDNTPEFWGQQAELARQYRLQPRKDFMTATENIAGSAQQVSAGELNAFELADAMDAAAAFPAYPPGPFRQAAAMLRSQAAELEAVGAGGVQPLSLQKPTGTSAEQAQAVTKSIAHGGKITRHSDMSVLVTFPSCRQASAFEQAIQGEATPGSGGWQAHAEAMERERDYWRQRANTMHEHQRGEVWYWQGDGGDNLHSLVNSLPVVIRADQLRELVAAAPAQQAQAAINSGAHAVPVVWLSGKQLQGVTGIHGSYLPFRRQREGLFDTPVFLEGVPADYEAVISDNKRLMLELDMLLNGNVAAPQAAPAALNASVAQLVAKALESCKVSGYTDVDGDFSRSYHFDQKAVDAARAAIAAHQPDALRTAAQAVVDRWDTPLWKDVPATAEYIGRLRAALGDKP